MLSQGVIQAVVIALADLLQNAIGPDGDTNALTAALDDIRRNPIRLLEKKRLGYLSVQSKLSTLQTKLSELAAASAKLTDSTDVTAYTATSSLPNEVEVTIGPGSVPRLTVTVFEATAPEKTVTVALASLRSVSRSEA